MNPVHIGAGVAVLLVLILGGLLKNSYAKNGELEAKLENQAEETNECVAANETSQVAIDGLTARIEAMVGERRADAERREQVLVERSQQLARARARAAELEREREDEINSNPECKELTDLSLDDFCPNTAFQLRQRSIGEGGDGNGDQGSTG